jgi:glycosyltransferase involved in cell wall biosynthesis
MMTARVDLSAIVPVTERYDDVEKLFLAYKDGVEATGLTYEFIYVLDGDYPEVLATLQTIKEQGNPIKIVMLARWFGEATALTLGFAQAAGDIILTLPAFLQVEAGEIPKLIQALDKSDMVVARRFPRRDSKLNVFQAKVFHLLLRPVTDVSFHDLGCALRVIKRRVLEELTFYGDQHRFLPLLAHRQGFRVIEVDAAQAKEDAFQRIYAPGVYIRRILDILSIIFIIKFTKKPLRFFGLIGSFTLSIGALGTLYLGIERLFFGIPLADRPFLILAVLMIVLGFQMIAVGLIGELIIFTHAKDVKEYTVDKIIE